MRGMARTSRRLRVTSRSRIGIALIAGALVAAACNRAQPEAGAPGTAVPPAPASAAPGPTTGPAPADAAAVDCGPALREVSGAIARMHGAMDGGPHYDRARAAWQAIDLACRGGRWHLQAAQLMRWRTDLVDGFQSATQALETGLARDPDLELLVLIAFSSALGGAPALPTDACERARAAPPVDGSPSETADRVAYVCGHAALAAGEPAAAEAELARIANQRRYPDLPLRRAQALHTIGRTADARSLREAAAAVSDIATRTFGGTDREHGALVAHAKSLP